MTTNAAQTDPAPRLRPAIAALRWAELLGLYWVIPLLIDFRERWQGRLLIPGLMLTGIVLFTILWFDRGFDRRSLLNIRAFKLELPRILITAAIACATMLATSWWLAQRDWSPTFGNTLFRYDIPTEFLLLILVFYPFLSVYPQEIILRTFFFHRYTPILGRGAGVVIGSALTFAWVHVIFIADKGDPLQWIPVYLCVPGGLLFGYTYWKTKSTIASGFEHAIVGDLMWLSGLGWFFFAGGAVASGG